MKQFLYLDYDVVNSIIAQSEQGIITEYSEEAEKGSTETTEKGGTANIEANAGGSLLKLAKAEATLSLQGTINSENSSHSTSKEMIAKTLHDAAFDVAYKYIKPNDCEMRTDGNDDYGNYVKVKRVFDFVDLDYLEILFSKNGLIDFLKKTEKEKIENAASESTESMNRDQLRKSGNIIKAKIKELITTSNKQYDDIAEIIKVFRQLIPYSKMMISSDGYLIPLDDKYFRINPSNLGFKYGGEISCVGIITNIIGADTNPDDNQNIFATLQFTINEALRTILPTKEDNLCVIHPIAVFYGK
ncbi:MAG TPA: hypothetical protein PLT66_02345 [Bacillota bacterium]|nr:hypothetical protein [Bacillota bacterium]